MRMTKFTWRLPSGNRWRSFCWRRALLVLRKYFVVKIVRKVQKKTASTCGSCRHFFCQSKADDYNFRCVLFFANFDRKNSVLPQREERENFPITQICMRRQSVSRMETRFIDKQPWRIRWVKLNEGWNHSIANKVSNCRWCGNGMKNFVSNSEQRISARLVRHKNRVIWSSLVNRHSRPKKIKTANTRPKNINYLPCKPTNFIIESLNSNSFFVSIRTIKKNWISSVLCLGLHDMQSLFLSLLFHLNSFRKTIGFD